MSKRQKTDMKTAVVIGANRGIGLCLAKKLKAANYNVIGTSRSASDAMKDFTAVSGIDVSKDECTAALAAALKDIEKIDVFVYVSGVGGSSAKGNWDRTDVTKADLSYCKVSFDVNALGVIRTVNACFDKLVDSKVLLTTSRMGSIADNTSGGFYEYRMSKAAMNAAGKSLSFDLKAKNTPVALIHPGMVATDMTGGQGISVDESCDGIMKRLEELSLETTGSFYHAVSGEVLPW